MVERPSHAEAAFFPRQPPLLNRHLLHVTHRSSPAGVCDVTGPGQYEALNVTGNSGPSYTLGGSRHVTQPLMEDNPGPGHYETAGPNRCGL